MASAAIAAGKHVWNEKPLAPDVAAGRALLDQAAQGRGAGRLRARHRARRGHPVGPAADRRRRDRHPDQRAHPAAGAGARVVAPGPGVPVREGGGAAVRPRAVLPVGAGDAVRPGDAGGRGRPPGARHPGDRLRAASGYRVQRGSAHLHVRAGASTPAARPPRCCSAGTRRCTGAGFVEITGTEATLAVPDPNQFDGDLRVRRADDQRVDRDRLARGGGGTRQRRGRHGPGDQARRAAPGLGRDGAARAGDDDRDRAVRRHGGLRAGRVRLRRCPRRSRRNGIRMSQAPSIGVGMVGYAFMGRAHSQAWRTVDRVFDLPLRPRLAAICGRDEAATERRRRPAGLGGGRDRLARADRPRRRAADRHRRPGQPARADRDRRPAGGQARAVREAAREHAGRGRADGGRGRRRVPERARGPWSGSTTGGCRPSRWPGGWSSRAGSARCATSAPCTCRTGWSTRTRR